MTYTTYTDSSGAYVNGTTPLSAQNMNNFRSFCLAGWFDSLITSNGSGALTTVQALFSLGSLTRWSKFTATVTTTPTFFNHGLGALPDLVFITLNGTSATAHSCFVDYTSFSTTQVKLTCDGAGLPIVGLAIKF